MHSPKMPTPPDPVATANAQANMNVTGGVTTQMLNMINQNTPQGSLAYNQTGMRTYTDPDGKTWRIPAYTATQTLSPEQQRLYNLDTQMQQNIGRIGVEQSAKIGKLLNTPLDLSNTSIDNALYQRYSPRVIEQQRQQNEALDAQLAGQGVTQGSEAWKNAIQQRDQAANDQWNQLYLGGRQQAIQEMVTGRQEPINEITALLSGSQVSNPTFGQTPSSSIAPPNYEQDVNNNYSQAMNAYQTKVGAQNALIGSIAGAVGAVGGGWATGGWKMPSDRRLKEDIERIGTLPNGLPWYSFRYIGDTMISEGVMADEVLAVRPDAVSYDDDGFASVDYSKVLQ